MCDISIIIPIYNAEKYIEQCIQSVLKQDIISKEIICIDDGSTDKSVSIIKKYMEQNTEIKLISQTNQGAGTARNQGIERANGRYIAFMDADDSYINEVGLRRMIEACDEKNVNICGSFLSILKKGEVIETDTYREIVGIENLCFKYEDYQYDLNYQCYIFKKSFLNKYNLRFPNYRRYQDPPFFVKAMFYAKMFCVVPINLYCYRLRDTKFSFSFLQINDALQGIKENIEFANENKLEILYKNTKEHLNKDLYYNLIETLENGNIEALEILLEIERIVKKCEDLSGTEIELKIIDWIFSALYENRKSGNWEYRFPYESIPYNSRVAIYGAGLVGKTMYYILKNTSYAQITVWIDKQYQQYQKEGLDVSAKEMLLQENFDYILVAVESKSLFEEIKDEVEAMGVKKKLVGPVGKMKL